MLYLNLRAVFKKRGISNPLPVMVKGGFTYHAAQLLLRTDIRRIYFDHLEKLCIILNCSVEELFVWSKPADSTVADNHPLHKLIAKEEESHSLVDGLKRLPLEKLAEVSKFVEGLQE